MSKQLLHAHQSHLVIVALNERAFVIVKINDGQGGAAAAVVSSEENNYSTPSAHVLELSVAAAVTPNGGANEKDNSGHHDGAAAVENIITRQLEVVEEGAREEELRKGGNRQRDNNSNNRINNPAHEMIQAVCCTEIESLIWLAVSRENKTLSLYSFPNPCCRQESRASKTTTTKVHPTTTYHLPKRAKCLAFGTVPSSSSSSSTAPHCHVVITGDLAGDAIAYPVVPPSNDNSSSVATTANPNPTTTTTTTTTTSSSTVLSRRLLLGHTASVLTGLNVVPSMSTTTTTTNNVTVMNNDGPRNHHPTQSFILTADRDEKIRVSHFPETHIVRGYLLGHSSFISSMDATTTTTTSASECGTSRTTKPLCITGSGDGTVRLWNYQMCKEVGMFPVVMKKCCSTDENYNEDTKTKSEEDADDGVLDEQEDEEYANDDFDEDFSDDDEIIPGHTIAVPISVALSPDGSSAVVVRDGISSIDIHPIPCSLSQPVSLHKKLTLDCPSQPLAVKCLGDGSVLVLGRSPDYLSHFQCTTSTETADGVSFNDVSSNSPFCIALNDAIGSEYIDMPATTLDRMWNKVNDPDHEWSKESGNEEDDDAQQKSKRGDFHWNDARRKEVDKLAQQRRKKRRKEGRKVKMVEEVKN